MIQLYSVQMNKSRSTRPIYIQLVVHRHMGIEGAVCPCFDAVWWKRISIERGHGDGWNNLRRKTDMKAAQAESDSAKPAAGAHTSACILTGL